MAISKSTEILRKLGKEETDRNKQYGSGLMNEATVNEEPIATGDESDEPAEDHDAFVDVWYRRDDSAYIKPGEHRVLGVSNRASSGGGFLADQIELSVLKSWDPEIRDTRLVDLGEFLVCAMPSLIDCAVSVYWDHGYDAVVPVLDYLASRDDD